MDLTKRAFVQAMRANPKDDNARLVFADWCDEHGDPQLAARLRVGPVKFIAPRTLRRKLQKKFKRRKYRRVKCPERLCGGTMQERVVVDLNGIPHYYQQCSMHLGFGKSCGYTNEMFYKNPPVCLKQSSLVK